MPGSKWVSRRGLLAGSIAAMAAPYFVPGRVLGKDGAVVPSNQITLGVIGYGRRCEVDLGHFLSFKEIRCLGVSDVKENRLKMAKQRVDEHHQNSDCKAHADFRELLGRGDVQAVLIATGNRWHGVGSIMAARAGKDVYSKKPISLTIAEGRALVETCK